jgi:hypothetical protein
MHRAASPSNTLSKSSPAPSNPKNLQGRGSAANGRTAPFDYSDPKEEQWWYDVSDLVYGEETVFEILCHARADAVCKIAADAKLDPKDMLLIAFRAKLIKAGVRGGNWVLPLAREIAEAAKVAHETYREPAPRAGEGGCQ